MALRSAQLTCLSLSALLACGGAALADGPAQSPPAKVAAFAALPTPSQEEARAKALEWLKGAGQSDAGMLGAFDDIWKSDAPLLDKVADTLALGDGDARRLLAEARDPKASAPTEVPALLKDAKRPAFFRANLALAYGKALTNRRVYEEALLALDCARPEQVIDPASYLFHRAVAEHGLGRAREASASIVRLLDDVPDAPARYTQLAALMVFDMMNWKDKDLGAVSRLMGNVQRRLDLGRGGPETRKIQDRVIALLDDLIDQRRGDGPHPKDPPPGPGKPGDPEENNGGAQSPNPMDESNPASAKGEGKADKKEKIRELAEVWGKLPERERAKAMTELTRDMPPRYRELIEKYFKELSRAESGR